MAKNEVWDLGDAELQEVAVEYRGKSYVLLEATGEVARQYRNAITNRTTIGDNGKPTGIRDIADIESILVSLSLFEVKPSANGPTRVRVPIDELRTWPDKIQRKLFERVKQISELDEAGDTLETSKNDSSGGEPGIE